MKKNPSPHDATFRQFLTQPEIPRDFMDIHLPAINRCHWSYRYFLYRQTQPIPVPDQLATGV
ncbi:hypothetical protein BOM25_12795 [Serratia sp. OPWLW2]|nr:hypothetical protein BOM26_17125 [Serratia sp. OPWLW3]PIJ43212.1 hypothetical protein BOM25_12795 [Serratia sp. OPWLW2]